MKRIILVLAAAALCLAAGVTHARAAKAKPPKVVFAESFRVLDQTAGKASAAASLKVNGRRQPVRITSALFVPLDGLGNTCGTSLKGIVRGAAAQFAAPHQGAGGLRITMVLRSAAKFGGKYYTVKRSRTLQLGGTDYECSWLGSPPPASQVCGYVFQPSSGLNCGVPVTNAPFWASQPSFVGGTVQVGHIAYLGGYCWVEHQGTIQQQTDWFGSTVHRMERWSCSNGLFLVPYLWVYLTAPGQDNGPTECSAGHGRDVPTPFGGKLISFQVPASIGGRLAVEWVFEVYKAATGQSPVFLGTEWQDAIFHLQGTQDGCPLLTTPASP